MAISLTDPLTILAGIKQFGLAPDGSDLRDLEAAIARLTTPAPVGQLVDAARDVLASWDARMADGPEQLKPGSGIIPPYWSPRASMVDAEAIAKLRTALAGGAVGDGWRLVPEEPTEAMLKQGSLNASNGQQYVGEYRTGQAWKAMLSASPTGRE